MATIASICEVNDKTLVTTDRENAGIFNKSNGNIGYLSCNCIRTYCTPTKSRQTAPARIVVWETSCE